MGLSLSLDIRVLGLRATGESPTCLLVGMVILIYVRVGTPLVDSELGRPQAKDFHYLWLEPQLEQEESATDTGPKDPRPTLKLKQGL